MKDHETIKAVAALLDRECEGRPEFVEASAVLYAIAGRLATTVDELNKASAGLAMSDERIAAAFDLQNRRVDRAKVYYAAQAAAAETRAEALAAFKAFVHKTLDDAGVPADPPGPHRDAWCRIGQRLAWVFARHNETLTELGISRGLKAHAERSWSDVADSIRKRADANEQRARTLISAMQHIASHNLLAHEVAPYASAVLAANTPDMPAALTEARLDAAYAAYLKADDGGCARFTLDRECLRAALVAAASAAP